ncbi:MAG: glycosyltransferase family 4 protein [Rhizomicrobium sp.]|nr:glycosyltransferase family 4 protein [Rhizomicrobium sp.]
MDGVHLSRPEMWRALPFERWAAALVPLFRKSIWRSLPVRHRRGFVTKVLEALAPMPSNAVAADPIMVCGYMGSATGLGEAARLSAEALCQLGHDVRAIDISYLMRGEIGSITQTTKILETGNGTLLLHFNPEALSVVLPLIGAAKCAGKRIIGYWSWELSRMPDNWVHSLRFVDEVWAPSQFTADAIRRATSKPVRVVPHPVAIRPAGAQRRADFGVAEDTFVVLCVFNFSSSIERKNPIGAIRAFITAFGDDPKAQLIIKTSGAARYPIAYRQVLDAAAGAQNIRVIEADLDRGLISDLIASVDVVLSLHRAEGFGLVMAEAMHAGKVVVATAWSGNLDFMTDETAALVPVTQVPSNDSEHLYCFEGQTWADADLDAAAAWLKRLADEPQRRRQMSVQAKIHAGKSLGLQAFSQAIAPALGQPALDRSSRL